MPRHKKAPHLNNCHTDEERALFFEQHSAFDLLEAGLMEEETPTTRYKLKPKKSKQLNIRIEPDLIDSIKALALKKGLAYQTLIHLWIQEKVREEKQATP